MSAQKKNTAPHREGLHAEEKTNLDIHGGWAAGPNNTKLWGRTGAAGLVLLAPVDSRSDSEPGILEHWAILMQHRAAWTSRGDTWALPGGAKEPDEDVISAAIREVEEETGIDPTAYRVVGSYVTAGPFPGDPTRPELAGNWTYTTVVGIAAEQLETQANNESKELRWVPIREVTELSLMPEFAQSWEYVQELIRTHIADISS